MLTTVHTAPQIMENSSTTLSILYRAPPDALPSELPSRAEIESSSEIFCEQSSRKVVGVGPHYAVKFGLQVDLDEGKMMIHVAKFTSIPVPCVYALLEDPADNMKFLIMQRIPGETLEQIWPVLTHDEKANISLQLKESFADLRRLPSPKAFCSLNNRPLPDALFWTGDTLDGISGPFDSEHDLNAALLKKYVSSEALPKGKAKFYERSWKSVFHGHQRTLTHGDLQRKNIMVTRDTTSQMRVTVVDWEIAGWYPSYWEYSRAMFACGRFDDDWDTWLEKILDPCLHEYAWMYILMLEMWS